MNNNGRKIRGVIFDMDGLMLDSEVVYQVSMERAGEEFGVPAGIEVFKRTIGIRSSDTRKIVEELVGVSRTDDFLLAWRKHEAVYLESNPIRRKPGLDELLAFLRQRKVPKAVATSTRRIRAIPRLESTGLGGEFEHIVCGDEIANGKPAPDIFLAAAKLLGLPAGECVVLEDSEAGVRGAKAAGSVAVMVPDLIQPSLEIRQLADAVYKTLHEATALLRNALAP
jgi:HAD superfamily hydrolase (TIGR01509 family)